MNRILCRLSQEIPKFTKLYSSKTNSIPTLPDAQYQTAHLIKEKGKIYDKKPFKIDCIKGKLYSWCACGRSRTQPLCDGSHNDKKLGPPAANRPVKFVSPDDGEYWFCNCKQTMNRPFCDGTHKRADIQAAIK